MGLPFYAHKLTCKWTHHVKRGSVMVPKHCTTQHSTRWGSSVTNWLVNPTNYSYIPLSTLEFTLSYLRQHLAIVNGGLTLCAACKLYQLMRNLACPSSLSNWRGKKEPEVMIAGAKNSHARAGGCGANGALPVRQAASPHSGRSHYAPWCARASSVPAPALWPLTPRFGGCLESLKA